jgi:hypothetical protein
MDYLDSTKRLRDHLVLMVGYVLVAITITIATLVLVYQAYGFGLSKNDTVIQNGLVFLSSQPNPANIYINGTLNAATTNTRLYLPSGSYTVKLTRTGYRPWRRVITFDAGEVEHFDYPLLFPKKLETSSIHTYTNAPSIVTQSPNRQWLLVEQPGSITNFDLYNLKNPASPVMTTITIPSNILSKANISESWQLDEWANDNQHVLLTHVFDGKTEYILVDIANPSQSVNLSNLYGNPTAISLNNKQYNLYYIFNSAAQTLTTAGLATGNTVTPYLSGVLAYQSYGSNTMLYVTNEGAPSGKVALKLLSGSQTIVIRNLPISPTYLLNLTTYSGNLYVAAGSTSSGQIYIYENPISQYTNQSGDIIPSQILTVANPNFLNFSDNAQFIAVEDGTTFAVYDIQNQQAYTYTIPHPLDTPQVSASWMDGDRLTYISAGKLIVFDYDGTNLQVLMPALPNYLPAFSTNYRYVFVFAPSKANKVRLTSTPLLTPPDL